MAPFAPASARELADILRDHSDRKAPAELGGTYSKAAMGGPRAEAAQISLRALTGVRAYEPADLTISVGAGTPYRDLERLLAENGQMLPLDPPFAEEATVGGVIATDGSGPRRRRFGTARDQVIGMELVTVDGKIAQSGGMVVKNVTGLDMAKLLIGSYGTLAAIASANFKVAPKPQRLLTLSFSANSPETLAELRHRIIRSQAEPLALDLINRAASVVGGGDLDPPWMLLAEVGGSEALVGRYRQEYRELSAGSGVDFHELEEPAAAAVWRGVRRFPKAITDAGGGLVRISALPTRLSEAIGLCGESAAVLTRAGNAVLYAGYADLQAMSGAIAAFRRAQFPTLIETHKAAQAAQLEQWAQPGPELTVMRRIKEALDPHGILSPGRLFGRI